MYNIKHIIISFNQKSLINYKKQNILDLENYLVLYKRKYKVQIIAYGLNSMFLHIIIRDEHNAVKEYVKTIIETLDYYYKKAFKTEVNLMRWKLYHLDDSREIMGTIRYLHKMDFNSNEKYANYSKYIYDDLIDTHLLISSNNMGEFLREPSENYIAKMKKKEKSNINNKMFKRRNRAEDFFNNYLTVKGISKEDLISSDFYKEELVDKFRNETDLSFRDIGYVLGISHTSVIRIWNKCIDNKL